MKNLRAIILLFTANTISGVAQGISMLAIPWYFVDVVKQPTLWGGIYGIVTFISLFWGLYAGILIDRFNRKHIFLAETLIGACVLFSIAMLGFYMGYVPTFWITVVFAITFFGYNIHYPTLYAFAQEITEPKYYTRITSWLEIQGQMTTMGAGVFGALLLQGIQAGEIDILGYTFMQPFSIEKWSLQAVFLLDASTYFLAFLLLLPMQYQTLAKRYKEDNKLLERFKIGLNFLKANLLIFVFGNAAYFVFVTTMLINMVLFPNFVKNYLNAGAGAFAGAEMMFALGAVFSGLLITTVFRRSTTVAGVIAMILLSGSMFLLLTFSRNLWVFFFACLCLGIANSGARIFRVTYLFRRIENQLIGRVQSIFKLINVLFRLSFILLFSMPFFVKHIAYAFAIFSLCCFIAALILIWYYKPLLAQKTVY